ncbi:hypothetical protein PHET_07474, partial [Paragonimus heterotremus]
NAIKLSVNPEVLNISLETEITRLPDTSHWKPDSEMKVKKMVCVMTFLFLWVLADTDARPSVSNAEEEQDVNSNVQTNNESESVEQAQPAQEDAERPEGVGRETGEKDATNEIEPEATIQVTEQPSEILASTDSNVLSEKTMESETPMSYQSANEMEEVTTAPEKAEPEQSVADDKDTKKVDASQVLLDKQEVVTELPKISEPYQATEEYQTNPPVPEVLTESSPLLKTESSEEQLQREELNGNKLPLNAVQEAKPNSERGMAEEEPQAREGVGKERPSILEDSVVPKDSSGVVKQVVAEKPDIEKTKPVENTKTSSTEEGLTANMKSIPTTNIASTASRQNVTVVDTVSSQALKTLVKSNTTLVTTPVVHGTNTTGEMSAPAGDVHPAVKTINSTDVVRESSKPLPPVPEHKIPVGNDSPVQSNPNISTHQMNSVINNLLSATDIPQKSHAIEPTSVSGQSSPEESTDAQSTGMKTFAFDLPMFNETIHKDLLMNETEWARELAAAAHPDEENTIHDPCTFIGENIHNVVGLNVTKEQVHNTLPNFRFLLDAATEKLDTIKNTLLACIEATTKHRVSENPGCMQIRSLVEKTCQESDLCKGREDDIMSRAMRRIREVIDTDQLADALLMVSKCVKNLWNKCDHFKFAHVLDKLMSEESVPKID